MYRRYFEAAAQFLESLGIPHGLYEGRKLAESELEALAGSLGVNIPVQLSDYLRELGDGFDFQWEHPAGGELFDFGLSTIEDIRGERSWLREQLREVSQRETNDLVEEAHRRSYWLPIIGIGEGGYEFCLDTRIEPAPVCYYESHWQTNRAVWQSSLAGSLLELVREWSRFCFSQPMIDGAFVDLTIIAGKLNGKFSWAPSYFDPHFDRGTAEAKLIHS
jgi:hypothetical protein